EMAAQSVGRLEVTTVAPTRYRADLGRIVAQSMPGEAGRLVTLDVRLDRLPHLMGYAGLGRVMNASWDVVHCWEEPYILAGAQIARHVPRDARFVVATFHDLAKQSP